MARIDKIINKYAGELQKIYDNQTAGDSTFHGVLGSFLLEIKNDPLVDKSLFAQEE